MVTNASFDSLAIESDVQVKAQRKILNKRDI